MLMYYLREDMNKWLQKTNLLLSIAFLYVHVCSRVFLFYRMDL